MDSMWTPKVSIIIPVYNGANYMREAIDSALAQTYENIEVIVVNDGSTDQGETDRVARSYGNRIIYLCKENGGVSSALNHGIRHMSGTYFSWLSHDDVYSPEKIRHQMDMLAAFNKKKAVALCAHVFINEKSERLSKKAPKRFTEGVHGWQKTLKEMLNHGAFFGCALLIPKEAFTECGLFHEGLRFSQDALMWMKLFLNQYALVYNEDEDVFSRIHGKQLTQTGRALFQKDSLTIGQIVIPELVCISNRKENYLYLFAQKNAKNGNRSVVKACVQAGKSNKLFGLQHTASLQLKLLYGNIRPTLRKVYYHLFVKAKRDKG